MNYVSDLSTLSSRSEDSFHSFPFPKFHNVSFYILRGFYRSDKDTLPKQECGEYLNLSHKPKEEIQIAFNFEQYSINS